MERCYVICAHSALQASFARAISPICTHRSLIRYAHSLTPNLKVGCKWGVWGEGGEASGSPHSCSAKLIYGKSAPEGRWCHMNGPCLREEAGP